MNEHSKRVIAGNTTAALAIANAIAAFGYGAHGGPATRKARKPVPTMVCSPPEEIATWNRKVSADSSERLGRIAARRMERRTAKAFRDLGQFPKFPKERVHKQHKHPLRDEHGAYTLVGRTRPTGAFAEWMVVRRIWLAGISAQRGY